LPQQESHGPFYTFQASSRFAPVNIHHASNAEAFFLLPVGGGIPAGVLLAHANGLAWPITTGLYLVSYVVLAIAFDPILRILVALGKR
jgi:hypothetical protein